MENKYINPDVLNQLYYFIADYYNDSTLADYILNIFSIKKQTIFTSNVGYEKFYRIMHYLHKMSGDQFFCFNAGRFFSETRLLKNSSIPGISFTPQRTISKIDKILKTIFPVFEFSLKTRGKGFLELLLYSNGDLPKPNYFFIEYIKGIISQVPKSWDLPLADVKVDSYPFEIEEILKDVDVPYRKDESLFFIYDREIAKEEKDIVNDNIQIIRNDVFIKDVFFRKNTKLNIKHLLLNIKWKNFSYLKRSLFLIIFLTGITGYIITLLNKLYPFMNASLMFLLYEVIVLYTYSIFRNKSLKKIYEENESGLMDELSLQRRTTSEAIQDTLNRLQSIENVIEITKELIYDKDISKLFENIRKLSAKALNADRTTVFLHDKEKKELKSGPELSDEKQEFSIPEDKGIVGEVFKLKKTVNVKDAYNNPLFNKSIDRQTGYETKTILSAPLLDLEKNFMGVIQVLNKKDGVFEKIDEHIIETLSTYIASALKDTLIINSLQKRGIDPDMLNGLSSVTWYLFNEYSAVSEALTPMDDPEILKLKSRINRMSLLLEKLAFLFDEHYSPVPEAASVGSMRNLASSFINLNKGNINIRYEEKNNIDPDLNLMLDNTLINKAISEILMNAIESIEPEGRIILRIYNYVIIFNDITHELSLGKLIMEYNSFSEENAGGFIRFVTSRKPFLESDLSRIKNNMKEFIALEFFDSGPVISASIKDKIFEPFFSTKKRFGLGLAIAKKALTLMEGMIEGPVQEAAGKNFRILIPVKSGHD